MRKWQASDIMEILRRSWISPKGGIEKNKNKNFHVYLRN